MVLKKDKQKVLGENFDDERILTFFNYEAYDDDNSDFHLLEKAYRGMKADNFATFLDFFVEKGHDINATNANGSTFLAMIANHRPAKAYIAAMKSHGAE